MFTLLSLADPPPSAEWFDFLSSVIGFVVGAAGLAVAMLQPVRKFLRRIKEIETQQAKTAYQLEPNGGGSLRDDITKIKIAVAEIAASNRSQDIEIRDIKQAARDLGLRVEANLQVIRRSVSDPGQTS